MVLAAVVLLVLALIFGPSLWVKLVMKRYSSQQPEMPGTGGELAKHLVERFSLKDVKVEVTELGDHYDPIEKKVRLLQEHYDSKSLTAIAIAAMRLDTLSRISKAINVWLLEQRWSP